MFASSAPPLCPGAVQINQRFDIAQRQLAGADPCTMAYCCWAEVAVAMPSLLGQPTDSGMSVEAVVEAQNAANRMLFHNREVQSARTESRVGPRTMVFARSATTKSTDN